MFSYQTYHLLTISTILPSTLLWPDQTRPYQVLSYLSEKKGSSGLESIWLMSLGQYCQIYLDPWSNVVARGAAIWGPGQSPQGTVGTSSTDQYTVEPVRKGKYRPLPNLVNIFYDITGCRFNMFTIFEMEWKSLFHHVKEFHLDGSCIQDNLSSAQPTLAPIRHTL